MLILGDRRGCIRAPPSRAIGAGILSHWCWCYRSRKPTARSASKDGARMWGRDASLPFSLDAIEIDAIEIDAIRINAIEIDPIDMNAVEVDTIQIEVIEIEVMTRLQVGSFPAFGRMLIEVTGADASAPHLRGRSVRESVRESSATGVGVIDLGNQRHSPPAKTVRECGAGMHPCLSLEMQ